MILFELTLLKVLLIEDWSDEVPMHSDLPKEDLFRLILFFSYGHFVLFLKFKSLWWKVIEHIGFADF